MRKFISSLFIATLFTGVFAQAEDVESLRPIYEMRGMSTDLWERDVDYHSNAPITLLRDARTSDLHRVNFWVNRWDRYCVRWSRQCVRRDRNGKCTSWRRVCSRWQMRARRVQKSILLNFRDALELDDQQEEAFELTIRRWKPVREGEDRVSTYLRVDDVIEPVVIRKQGDYRYYIELKD